MKEQIVVKLPLTMTSACAVMKGVGVFFPNAKVILDAAMHSHGTEALVIEVDFDDLRREIDEDATGEEWLSRFG